MNLSVELRPFPFEALPRVWGWMEGFRAKVADDFAPQTLGQFLTVMADKWEHPDFKAWSISADGELGGMITFERVSPWLGTAHLLLKPNFQGKGVSIVALRRAFAQMFDLGIGKLAFYPLGNSLAVGSLLVNLGARREGKLVSHTLVGGKPADVNLYGLLKEEFLNHAATHPGSSRNGVIDLRSDQGLETADLDHHGHPAA